MLQYERTNAVVSLTLVGLALYFVLEFPLNTLTFAVGDTTFNFDNPQRWLMISMLMGLVMAGTDMVMRSHPALFDFRLRYLATFWMLPGLLVFAATQVLNLAPNLIVWGEGLIGVGLLLWLTIAAEFQQVTGPDRAGRLAYIWQQFVGYSLALILIFLIYQARNSNLVSSLLVLLISGGLSLSLLRQQPHQISKTWLFALTIGLGLGQITWAFRYWQTSLLQASLILFLTFYVLTGLAHQHLAGKLSPRILGEFGVLALVGLILISYL